MSLLPIASLIPSAISFLEENRETIRRSTQRQPFSVTLRASKPGFIQARQEDKTLLGRAVQVGESFEWVELDSLHLGVTNAGGVELLIEGSSFSLGTAGELVTAVIAWTPSEEEYLLEVLPLR